MVDSFDNADSHIEDNKNSENESSGEDIQGKQFINYGQDDQMEIEGYVSCNVRNRITWIFYILTLGTLRLFFHWYPHLKLRSTYKRCSLKNAEKVLVIDKYHNFKSYFVKDVKTLRGNIFRERQDDKQLDENSMLEFNLCDGRQKQFAQARIITCKKLVYVWDEEKNTFTKLAGFDKGINRNELHSFKGQGEEKQALKRITYGPNEITVPVQTISTLIILEALTPFYVFQVFSLIVWLCEKYYYYTIALIIMSVTAISTSVIQTRKNQKNLRGKVNFVDTVTVCRGNDIYERIPTTELVPGDLIMIPSGGCQMQCDAVLLTGHCVVNESMLTGESVPITKTPLPADFNQYNLREDTYHTIFCGTKIIQTRCKGEEQVSAVVIRTGYLTAKGELVRSILYPPPADFKFERDSYKFIGILAMVALLGMIYTIASKSSRQINPLDILMKALDLITIAVPPALPAVMTVGKLYALSRLEKKHIFCINSRVINVSGSVDCVCFDKTGTLTEDEMDMWGVVPVENRKIKETLKRIKGISSVSPLIKGMATCHSLSIINGELEGDPLDLKMFESTEWELQGVPGNSIEQHIEVKPKEDSKNNFQLGIVKQFQFSSHLQRMSVIVKSSNSDTFEVFCKGSPEMIMSLSSPTSLPEDLLFRLEEYTGQGYRVIALGKKELKGVSFQDVMKLGREAVESELEFIGLIVLENKLKPQTTEVIKTLKDARLKVVMITGDNIRTGIHIAKECGMVEPDQDIIEILTQKLPETSIPSIIYRTVSPASQQVKYNGDSTDIEKYQKRRYCFAVTGKVWADVVENYPDLISKIVTKGTIFARMSGMQKQQLVEELKKLGYSVAMCGDGANDCGALRAAHVGISLSEAESSVASPFTSKEQNISCVPEIIKEGRAALVTSFGVFKIMLCFSLTEFAAVSILYNIDSNLTSMQFLFIDIPLIMNFAAVFGNTKAFEALDPIPPRTSLIGFIPISSIVLFLTTATVFQLLAYYWIQTYSWFTPFVYDEDQPEYLYSYENYAVFSVSIFQYITMNVAFSKGKPYRKPLYTNTYFSLSLLLTTALCVYLVLNPFEWLRVALELQLPPMEGRYPMLIISVVNFAVCIFLEDLVVEYFLGKVVEPPLRKMRKSRRKFLAVLEALDEEPNWPRSCARIEEKGTVNNGFVGSQSDIVTNVSV
ncbi:polyamine-transporting ATPase 13A3 isoform X1 [Leptinotarsa decemlineata]|uniref:polyamine-transporting ATPase 13A3 isoform X1 n=1 Tax=Leptinotarsa decemlineata TaxID=7539 RepID=UPI003D3077E6